MIKIAVLDANQKASKDYRGIVSSVVGQWIEWEMGEAGVEYVTPDVADLVFVSHASALDFTKNVPRELRRFGIEVDPAKRNRNPYLIAGGPVDATPFVALQYCDGLVVGEGYRMVRQILELVKSNGSLDDVRDMFVEDAHAIERSEIEHLERDKYSPWLLKDEIGTIASPDPFVDWTVPPVKTDDNVVRIVGSKGCHFKCSFCATTYRQKYTKNPNDRNVRAMARGLHKRGERVQILSNDPANLPYYPALSDALDSGSYTIEEFMKPENRAAIIRQRPKIVRFGVEGISERIRYAWNKPIPNPQLMEVMSDLRANKINSHMFIIVNAPYEAASDWEDWRQFVAVLSREHDWGILRLKFTTFQPSPPAPLSRFVQPFTVRERWDKFFESYIRNDVSTHLALIPPRRSAAFIRTVGEGLSISDDVAEGLLNQTKTVDLAPTAEDFARMTSNIIEWPIDARRRWKVGEIYKQRMAGTKPLPASATVKRVVRGVKRMRDRAPE